MKNYPVEFIPPRSALKFPWRIYNEQFQEIGSRWLRTLIDEAGLEPHERVLDVGSGIGRIAIPLTTYLSPDGEYFGFDIVEDGIDWCSKEITPKHPNFKFYFSDVYNKLYNPDGAVPADKYIFPHEDNYFDFVSLTSVFTHMLQGDLDHYLGEIYRVMKIGGRCIITYFLLNEESRNLIKNSGNKPKFSHKIDDGVFVKDIRNPEVGIAYREDIILGLYEKYGFDIRGVCYGKWCGRENGDFQDRVYAVKR